MDEVKNYYRVFATGAVKPTLVFDRYDTLEGVMSEIYYYKSIHPDYTSATWRIEKHDVSQRINKIFKTSYSIYTYQEDTLTSVAEGIMSWQLVREALKRLQEDRPSTTVWRIEKVETLVDTNEN